MKKTLVLIFILYLVIFISAGVFFYNQYISNFLSDGKELFQVEIINPSSLIYYSKKNVLYRVDPQNQTEALQLNNIETFPLAGEEVGRLDIDNNNLLAAFDIKNADGNWEVWQATVANLQTEKLAYLGLVELAGFDDFTNPQFSPNGEKLAFIAQGTSEDVIFIKNLANNVLQKIAADTNKISDYSWNKDSSKIIFCTSNLVPNGCWNTNLETLENSKIFQQDVKKISWNKTDDIFYLSKAESPHLYAIRQDGSDTKQLDDVSSPKQVVTFQIDPAGKKIVYEVTGEEKSDIYLADIDGANRLQLTTDGKADQPLFSTDGKEIAYLKQKDGLYLINTRAIVERKIVNFTDTIDFLLLWR